MNQVNTAVIGVGNMGKNHARIYSEISNLVAIADPNEEVGKEVAKQYNTKYYSDYKTLLENEDIDAVSVVVPTKLHLPVVKGTLTKGVKTLLEKPIAGNTKDAQEIIKIMRDTKTPLLIGHIERFNPAVIKAKEIVDVGVLGDIINLLAIRVGFRPPATPNSDVALDLGIHDIDIFNYLIEELPISKEIITTQIYRNNIADSANIVLKYKNSTGVITTNWVTPTKMRKLLITGTKGYLELDYIKQQVTIYNNLINNKKIGNFYDFISLSDVPQKDEYITKGEPLKEELKYFLDQDQEKDFKNITNAAFEALKILKD